MPGSLVKRRQPNRGHIDLGKADEVRYWTKHLGVDQQRLADAIARVGNAAAAVRKELKIENGGDAAH